MAFTTINDSSVHFQTKLWTGDGSDDRNLTNDGNANLQPDMLWNKRRSTTGNHQLHDAVRGVTAKISPNTDSGQGTEANAVQAFQTDGFQVGNDANINGNGTTYVAWQWKAGGPTPSITFIVKVVSDSGNKYRLDNASFSTHSLTTYLQEGGTYTFDQSDSSNAGHPLRFSTTSDGSHGGGSEYTTGVTTNGVPGQAGAYTRITVAASAPTLYYYCTQHSGMGGSLDTNDNFTTSNYYGSNGSATVRESINTTAGFSILRYAGTGSNMTIGHRLGAKPQAVWIKRLDGSANWRIFHHLAYTGDTGGQYQNAGRLNETTAWEHTANAFWNNTAFTSTTISLGTNTDLNDSGAHYVAYAFTGVKGFSKFGMYLGNGDPQGRFCFTGFRPEFVMYRECTAGNTNDWNIVDGSRSGGNLTNLYLRANENSGDADGGSNYALNFLSNGFKVVSSNAGVNRSGGEYIYFAFAKSPMVGTNDVAGTAAY